MEKYKCNGCDYIYNPEKGEGSWENYIPPNTPFNKLLDSWVCPACGAPKDMFEKAELQESPKGCVLLRARGLVE